jgi:hypothetical protein
MTTTLAVRYTTIAMAGMAINDVTYATMPMLFINSCLKYHLFDGKYDPDAYIS